MLYSIVYYPDLKDQRVDQFREEYDPYVRLIRDHLAIVFPFPAELGLDVLENHMLGALRKWNPFDVHFEGFEKSWDHWLFLTITKGEDELIAIHDDLYTCALAPFLREDIQFKPHVALGYFGEDKYNPLQPESLELNKAEYTKALEKIRKMELSFHRRVKRLTVVETDDALTKSRDILYVNLGGI